MKEDKIITLRILVMVKININKYLKQTLKPELKILI